MAGHDPEVVKVRGLGIGPSFLHVTTEGRKEVEKLTGQRVVPVLVTDSGEAINDSRRIVDWAERNPAS
jgi:glutaredoxin 2